MLQERAVDARKHILVDATLVAASLVASTDDWLTRTTSTLTRARQMVHELRRVAQRLSSHHNFKKSRDESPDPRCLDAHRRSVSLDLSAALEL